MTISAGESGMRKRKRLRREEPLRTGPVRGFSGIYGRSGKHRRYEEATVPKPRQREPAAGVPNNEPVARAVALGYQVIEDYLRAGREAAAQLSSRQTYNGRVALNGLPELVNMIVRGYSEALPVWVELANSLLRVEGLRTRDEGSVDRKSSVDDAHEKIASAISIELVTTRPVRAKFEMHKASHRMSLVAHGLRAVEADKPPLNDIKFVQSENDHPGTLRIFVPASQPAGRYSGVVVDRSTGEPCGTLSVVVREPLAQSKLQ